MSTDERPLPRSEKQTVYRLGVAERARRGTARPTHIFKVERVRIGSNAHGEPVFTEYPDHRALCGVWTVTAPEQADPTTAGDPACLRKYLRMFGRQNSGGGRS
jgi:hypothetical protein